MKRIPIAIVMLLIAAPAHARCRAEHGRVAVEIRGEVHADSTFERATPDGRFIVVLEPHEFGWVLRIHQPGRPDDDLSRLTPPWHFVPNPREIEGWHLRNADNTGPNEGSVNAPGEWREFIFSPEVGRTIEYNGSNTTEEDVAKVEAYGRGTLAILDYELSPPEPGERARFERMKFTICLTWPKPQPKKP
jgi:hypothetical protein